MENEIKRCWTGTTFNTGDFEPKDPKRHTALQSLIERYKRFSMIGFIYAFVSPLLLGRMLAQWCHGVSVSMYLFLAYSSIYFLSAALTDRWFVKGISSINLNEMTVSEVWRKAYYYRKKHLQSVMVFLPMAIFLIGWMVLLLSDAKFFFYGVFLGGCLGVVIGVFNFKKFMQEYREVMSD